MDCTSSSSCCRSSWTLPLAVVIGGVFFLIGVAMYNQVKPEYTLRSDAQPAQISVSGEGKVSAVPDIAMLSFGVTTGRVPSAKTAMETLSKKMNAIVDAVKKQGVEDKDITTQQLSLNPVYDYTQSGQVPRGFEASQSLQVKVRDLDKIGTILGVVTDAGANQAGGVSFTIDKPEQLQAQARSEAIKQAQDKAKVLADQLGVKLGKIMQFSEGGNYGSPVPMMLRSDAMGKSAVESGPVPVPVGEQEIQSNVTLTYGIE